MCSDTKELDKHGSRIQEMFAAVAPRYDFLNRLLSASRDVVWRRLAAEALDEAPEGPALDLCCGTGDQALALQSRGRQVVAADFCLPMLALARQKYARAGEGPPSGLAADTLILPLPTSRFAGVTVSFGLRNVADLDAALAEMVRVLAPGGRTAILEFAIPENSLLRGAYLFYFTRVLPRMGRWFSHRGSAYSYLPASVLEFPQRREFTNRMGQAGFEETSWHNLSGGIVCLYTGKRKP